MYLIAYVFHQIISSKDFFLLHSMIAPTGLTLHKSSISGLKKVVIPYRKDLTLMSSFSVPILSFFPLKITLFLLSHIDHRVVQTNIF